MDIEWSVLSWTGTLPGPTASLHDGGYKAEDTGEEGWTERNSTTEVLGKFCTSKHGYLLLLALYVEGHKTFTEDWMGKLGEKKGSIQEPNPLFMNHRTDLRVSRTANWRRTQGQLTTSGIWWPSSAIDDLWWALRNCQNVSTIISAMVYIDVTQWAYFSSRDYFTECFPQ